ncbi:MAG: DUF6172 family protein [Nannocystales bacterium]
MRKSFSLEHPKHKPARVVENIKHQLRKYIKRERGKTLPEDMDFWAFDCKIGRERPERTLTEKELGKAIDDAAAEGWESVHVELIATPVKRLGKKPVPDSPENPDE